MQHANEMLEIAADAIECFDPAAAKLFRTRPFHRELIAKAVIATLRKGKDPLDMASTIEDAVAHGMAQLRECAA